MYIVLLPFLFSQQATLIYDEPTIKFVREEVVLDYKAACAESIATGKPLIVYVGVEPKLVAGSIACGVDSLPGYVRGDVVECTPGYKEVYFERYIRRGVVSQRASPLSESERPTADVEDVSGRLPFLKRMKRYERAKYTQSLFGYNFDGPFISRPVSRTGLLRKWQVPGGLENVAGWQSDLYEYLPEQPQSYRGYSRVPQGFRTMPSFRQTFADGTVLADVLSYNGKVFEVRVAEKNDGEWQRYVAFKNVGARPDGYHGLTSRQCVECHSQTQTGGYGTGVVPGDDTVLSKGIPEVERGYEVYVGR